MPTESRRQRYEKLRIQLETERASFMSHWRDLGDYILPRRPRFTQSDVNKGDKKNQKIIDATGTFSARTLRSGMMSGVTSPARPWFRLSTHNPGQMEDGPVKEWLHLVTERMRSVFSRSNLYNALPIIYGDIGVFGTGALAVEEDFDNVVHFTHFPIGSYCISVNDKGYVNVFQRSFQMTVRQIVDKFLKTESGEVDFKNASRTVQQAWEDGRTEEWIEVCHIILPNEQHDPGKPESRYKKFSSCYYELSTGSGNSKRDHMELEGDKFLRDSGLERFNILVPRWETNSEDAYGTDCPGMQVLGDVKQLQLGEKRAMQAIEKMVNPPMVGPSHLRNSNVSILPGDITYVDSRDAANTLRPAHEVSMRIGELEDKNEGCRQRIKHGFMEDMFLALSMSDRREITAREVEERHEEKLWALGPVLERLNQDLLDPLVDLTFAIMLRQGLIPAPPKELQGGSLKIEYTSVMAQAQKLVGLSSVERFTQYASSVAAINPETLDKLDTDQLIDVYGDLTGVPPGLVRTDEKAEEIRRARAEAQAEQQKLNNMQQLGQTAKDLGSAASTVSGGQTDVMNKILGGG